MKSRPVGLECKISSGVDSVSVLCVRLSSRVASGAVGFWRQIVDGEKAMKDAWIFSTASDEPHKPSGQRPFALRQRELRVTQLANRLFLAKTKPTMNICEISVESLKRSCLAGQRRCVSREEAPRVIRL